MRVATIERTEEVLDREDPFQRFFRRQGFDQRDLPEEFRQDGAGSGFVIAPEGWIVTNYHVVEDATTVQVMLGGREYDAEVRGTDPSTDLALLKIDAGEELKYLALGDSESLRVGDWVMAIGSPQELESTVTVGIVSALGRSGLRLPGQDTSSFQNFIQTDAAINRGNSGGPLVNTSGEVIGISTAMSFGAENIGFAVPVDTLERILPQLRSEGRVRRGYLGVNIDNLDYRKMQAFGAESTDGALIQRVEPDTPASEAGLEAGDIILRVDEHNVKTTRDLIDYVSSKTPGSKVELEVLRNRRTLSKTVTLKERDLDQTAEIDIEEPEQSELEWLGIEYTDLSRDWRERLNIRRGSNIEGVLVLNVAPSSPLYEEGVGRYTIISEVNGNPVTSAREFERAVSGFSSGDFLRLYVQVPTQAGFASRFAIVEVP